MANQYYNPPGAIPRPFEAIGDGWDHVMEFAFPCGLTGLQMEDEPLDNCAKCYWYFFPLYRVPVVDHCVNYYATMACAQDVDTAHLITFDEYIKYKSPGATWREKRSLRSILAIQKKGETNGDD